eukprot:EG_transcript_19849
MSFPQLVLCSKAALCGGLIAGITNTAYQSLPRRKSECGVCLARAEKCEGTKFWNVSSTLQWFAMGSLVTSVASPIFIMVRKGSSAAAVFEAIVLTNGLLCPLHLVAWWPDARLHVARRLPEHLAGGLFAFTATLTGVPALLGAGGQKDPKGYLTATGVAVGGWLVFLMFCFVNKLAVTELHLLYHHVLPRQRDDPEVDSFAALVRFCQLWGNLTVAMSFLALLAEPQGGSFLGAFLDSSLPDVFVCNVLFLGLFHHMQAIECTKEEKMLHHGTWVAFVPATFFSGANPLIPVACASLFLWSYEPYWRAMEELAGELHAPST